MHISNILTPVLESIGPNINDLALNNVNAFKLENGVLDAAFSIINKTNKVIYAVDVMIHLNTKDFRITSIDIQDHDKTYDGDLADAKLAEAFLHANYETVITQMLNDLDDNNDGYDRPFNKAPKSV